MPSRMRFHSVAVIILCGLTCRSARPVLASDERLPTRQEVQEQLQREPISPETWPAWRVRLLVWITEKGHSTDQAYDAARDFVKAQANNAGELIGTLADDAFAWYLLSGAHLQDMGGSDQRLLRVEKALHRSIQLDPGFSRAHRQLALAVFLQEGRDGKADTPNGLNRRAEAERALTEARRLDPKLATAWVEGVGASNRGHFGDAERFFKQAFMEDPEDVSSAFYLAHAIVVNLQRTGARAPEVQALMNRFPDHGPLVCMHAMALAADQELRAAVKEFERARQLGVDPAEFIPAELLRDIEEAAEPGLLERFGWIMLYFALFYVGVMLLMALVGVLLAGRTRGSKALGLLGTAPEELVTEGQVARTAGESALARFYSLALVLGLILFYAAIPFLVGGLLAGTGLLLYMILHARRVPVKLIAIVAIVGGGAAWAIVKSVFASVGSGGFGLPKSPAECPRVHQLVKEVADRVNTEPVDQILIAPNSSIGVHQEGRGPFGLFGVKQRVLTLGLSSLNFLTVGELKSILAHEYAHFSHSDTFYSRFIYRVDLSISNALHGMTASGGWLNYINPFYWFLVLYYKSYALLSAGYSRSREFLADRMAGVLYGSDVFASALSKVCTDGALFEATIYHNIQGLLGEDKAFINMYTAFRAFRNEQLTGKERDELYQKLLNEEGSLFASHPTFKERIDAIAELPKAHSTDSASAMQLFDNAEEMEKEMTEFLTGYVSHVQLLQAQAAQEQ